MTIIEPNKRKKAIKRAIVAFGPITSIVLAGVIANILLYSNIVELRHAIEDGEAALQELTVENAELTNRFYGLIGADALSGIADRGGLILEKKPLYLGVKELANSN